MNILPAEAFMSRMVIENCFPSGIWYTVLGQWGSGTSRWYPVQSGTISARGKVEMTAGSGWINFFVGLYTTWYDRPQANFLAVEVAPSSKVTVAAMVSALPAVDNCADPIGLPSPDLSNLESVDIRDVRQVKGSPGPEGPGSDLPSVEGSAE